MSVWVQVNRIGDPAEGDRLLDAMEQETGVRGERDGDGRRYVFDDLADVGEATDWLAARLGPGWQNHLEFVV